ncbi:alpha-amylase, partial [Pseudoalteromonas sp. Angola-31]|nr:alpha-amylase [Pseudoalteromonas sp. Angola-31]
PTRTSIFDYIGVPAHQAWMNNGKFDGGQLTTEQAQLRQYYISIMALNDLPAIVAGDMAQLMITGSDSVVGFVRTLGQQSLWVLSNFSQKSQTVTVTLSPHQALTLKPNSTLNDLLEAHNGILVNHDQQNATFTLTLDAFSSAVLTNKADHEL